MDFSTELTGNPITVTVPLFICRDVLSLSSAQVASRFVAQYL